MLFVDFRLFCVFLVLFVYVLVVSSVLASSFLVFCSRSQSFYDKAE